jgi:hypothetical protein
MHRGGTEACGAMVHPTIHTVHSNGIIKIRAVHNKNEKTLQPELHVQTLVRSTAACCPIKSVPYPKRLHVMPPLKEGTAKNSKVLWLECNVALYRCRNGVFVFWHWFVWRFGEQGLFIFDCLAVIPEVTQMLKNVGISATNQGSSGVKVPFVLEHHLVKESRAHKRLHSRHPLERRRHQQQQSALAEVKFRALLVPQ